MGWVEEGLQCDVWFVVIDRAYASRECVSVDEEVSVCVCAARGCFFHSLSPSVACCCACVFGAPQYALLEFNGDLFCMQVCYLCTHRSYVIRHRYSAALVTCHSVLFCLLACVTAISGCLWQRTWSVLRNRGAIPLAMCGLLSESSVLESWQAAGRHMLGLWAASSACTSNVVCMWLATTPAGRGQYTSTYECPCVS